MYINSTELKEKIAQTANVVKERSNGRFVFEEYIALPYYGNIILRFNITDENYTIDDLDHYENLIYEWIDDDFFVDFMGSVYKQVGFDFSKMRDYYLKCLEIYQDEDIYDSIYASKIREDGKYLLKNCGYDENLNVWEIQVDEDELALLILSDETRFKESSIVEGVKVEVIEVERTQCEGLMRATFYARRNHISIMKAIMVE